METKKLVSLLALCAASLTLMEGKAHAQLFNSNSSCGALGYACLHGRTCQSQRCQPAWIDLETEGAPPGSFGASSEPVDGEYVVFGGCDAEAQTEDPPIAGGGAYDLTNDEWSSVAAMGLDRQYASSVSSGTDVYVFGGLTSCYWPYGLTDTTETLASPSGSWSAVSAANPPSPRYNGSMAWTGTELVVFGGSDDTLSGLYTGARRTLLGDWTFISCGLESCERGGPYDMWSADLGGLLGVNVRVWGGAEGIGNAPTAVTYSMLLDSWSTDWETPSGGPNFSTDICGQASGDSDGTRRVYYLASGGVWLYDRLGESWSFDDEDWPSSLSPCAAASWVGGELVAWSGDGMQYGARYQPPAP